MQKLKILWFANTPCGAAFKLNLDLNVCGWLKSLEEQLVQVENIELSVSFYWGEEIDPFEYNGTTYYPIYKPRDGSKVGRLINRVFQLNSDKKDIPRLLKVIELVNPDLIHVHGTENNFGLIQEFVRVPAIVSIQGILSPYMEKYYSGIPLTASVWHEGVMPKVLFRSVKYLYNNLRDAAIRERYMLLMTKHVFGRTDWDRRITHLLAPSSTYFVGNEILRPAFYENTWQKKKFGTPLQLVTVMTRGLHKGLESVVKTAQVLSNRKEFDFKWTIIGQAESDDLVKIVRGWMKVNFKSLNIILVGSKKEKEVADILLQSDIYCQVSHIENSPNSLCEAMLIGMPIVATFAGGTDSMLENNKEGILVQSGDSYSLGGAILEMSQDFDKAIQYGSNARIRSSARHDPQNIVKEVVTGYKTILATEGQKKMPAAVIAPVEKII